jgi:hypothetical protein
LLAGGQLDKNEKVFKTPLLSHLLTKGISKEYIGNQILKVIIDDEWDAHHGPVLDFCNMPTNCVA